MTRPARAVFVLLVVATFAAFFVAQRLKSAPQVAVIKKVTRHFSPNGDGRRDVSRIRVRVRKDDDVTISIVDASGTEVKRIAQAVPAKARRGIRVRWDGTTATGSRAPEGLYRVRVSLRRGGRAVILKPGLALDVRAPRPTVLAGGPEDRWITGPVGGPVPFRVRVVSRRYPTRMTVLRTDAGAPREVAAFRLPPGEREGEWDGTADGAPAPPGTYQIVAAVRDQAGNVGRSAPEGPGIVRGEPGVSVRSLLVRPPADPVRAGADVEFAVDSRGRPYRWRVHRVGGVELSRAERRRARRTGPPTRGRKRTGGELKLRAPEGDSGVYALTVRAGRDATTVPFAVQAEQPAPILVVLPAITWFGSDPLDDDRDGIPNTLANGGPAAYPRLLAGGLPARLRRPGRRAARLPRRPEDPLRRHDRPHAGRHALRADRRARGRAARRADALDLDRAGAAPAPLRRRRRARRVVRAESLRRGVDVARNRLLRPLPPSDTDPFGAKLRPLRRLDAPETLQPIADEGATGLLTGVEALPGFATLEEAEPDERVRAALAAVDVEALEDADSADEPLPEARPALSLSELGDGIVIRVGLPEWGARLRDGSVPVQQLTRNIADILRGATPRIRSF